MLKQVIQDFWLIRNLAELIVRFGNTLSFIEVFVAGSESSSLSLSMYVNTVIAQGYGVIHLAIEEMIDLPLAI